MQNAVCQLIMNGSWLLQIWGFKFLLHRSRLTHVTTIIIIILIWLYALALSLPPIFGWGRYVPEISGLGCTPDWHSEKSSKSYIVYIMFFGFCIPTLIIIISSLLTYVEGGCFQFACLTRTKNLDENTWFEHQGQLDDHMHLLSKYS